MKVVIFAGGYGTRLGGLTDDLPKPLVKIGDMPILWHIMKCYADQGFDDFIICAGYKHEKIREFFRDFSLFAARALKFELSSERTEVLDVLDRWKVTVVNTGLSTLTAGRLGRVLEFIDTEQFFLTYGDGLSDINFNELLAFHRNHKAGATVTGVIPPGRFGSMTIDKNLRVSSFSEKVIDTDTRINGGFFVLDKNAVENLMLRDDELWEHAPMIEMVSSGELFCYEHNGFWHPMDVLRDKKALESYWENGEAPWSRFWKR